MSKVGLALFGLAVILYCAWTICAAISIGPIGGLISVGIWERMMEIWILFLPLLALCVSLGIYFTVDEIRSK